MSVSKNTARFLDSVSKTSLKLPPKFRQLAIKSKRYPHGARSSAVRAADS
jgi:hypothetical protein